MGNGEEVTNALCPMRQATGRLSLSTHVSVGGASRREAGRSPGIEFPVAFNDFVSVQQYLVLKDTLR
ncbi:MAG: hypothetical protein V7K14_09975 [Nostoc sp.]|uniref:hypothetical protein n=1 Tax=Nostoc sp. TaxID=1180 RepID=UPI002FF654BE